MKAGKLFRDFIQSERSGGMVLVACTVVSLLLANSGAGEAYHHFWQAQAGGLSIELWINDGLMTIFFLLVGLELRTELYVGKLSKVKDAMFPTLGALGGMLLPAAIFFSLNYGTPLHSGAGIPMATDIAFSLGVLSLLGNRVPTSLKVFLTALAVIDDLGAIVVIAVFYTTQLMWVNLFSALGVFLFLALLNRLKIKSLIPYLIGGVAMWYFMLHSGVHATISGVLLAFVIPFGEGKPASASYRLQHFLHQPVAFFILPLFALANTAITLQGNLLHAFAQDYSLGVAGGLIIGKPFGIFIMTLLCTKLGFCQIPADLNWRDIFSVGILGGIGFTMSIFVTLLAYTDPQIIAHTKLTILLSSTTAGLLGLIALHYTLKADERYKHRRG